QGQLFAENVGQFLQGQFDFEDVPARLVAGLRITLPLRGGERLTRLAVPDADPAGPFLAVPELGKVDLWEWDRHEVVSLFPDHFPFADVPSQVRFDLAADDLPEPLQVLFDLLAHGARASRVDAVCPVTQSYLTQRRRGEVNRKQK